MYPHGGSSSEISWHHLNYQCWESKKNKRSGILVFKVIPQKKKLSNDVGDNLHRDFLTRSL